MKNLKEQKPNVENVQAVDVELNEEQLDVVAGGGIIDEIAKGFDIAIALAQKTR